MSPEQLAGEEVDGRSDQYSLALVAFNLLTGDLPFPSASTGTLVVMRLTQAPRSLADVRPEITWPNELQAAMSRALERDPSLRFVSTRDFAHALHAGVAMMPARAVTKGTTRPIEAVSSVAATKVVSPPPRSGRSKAQRERRLTWMIAIALAVVLAAAVLGSRGLIQRARARTALDQGIAAYRNGRHDVARNRLLTASNIAPNDPMPHVYLARLARETNDLGIASDEAVKAVRLGENNAQALRELATTLYATQNYSGARAFYARAIKADPTDRISQGYLGCSLIQLGRVEEGRRWIQRAGSGTWSTCAAVTNSVASSTR
jgi:cytochrome c-type biogenesis protein CcmH/NrfG